MSIPSQRVPGLDLLRACAVTVVLLFHYSIESDGRCLAFFGRYGWAGVDLFFVLSGYLIGSQVFREITVRSTLSLRSFFAKRLFRTLPVYGTILTLYLIWPSLRERSTMAPAWRFFTFTLNEGLNRRTGATFSHAWSLCVEEQFYLLFPFLGLLLFRRLTTKVLVALCFGVLVSEIIVRGCVWHFALAPIPPESRDFGVLFSEWIYYPTHTRLDGLVMGLALAAVKIREPQLWQTLERHWLMCLAVGVILVVSGLALASGSPTFTGSCFSYALLALGFALSLIAFVSPLSILARTRVPGAAELALISYSLYLVQKMAFHAAQLQLTARGLDPFNHTGLLLTGLACLLSATLLYFIIERPFLVLRGKYLGLKA